MKSKALGKDWLELVRNKRYSSGIDARIVLLYFCSSWVYFQTFIGAGMLDLSAHKDNNSYVI